MQITLQQLSSTNKLALAGSAAAAYVVYKLFSLYMKRRKYSHLLGPKPSGLTGLIFGSYGEIDREQKKDKYFNQILTEWAQKYGSYYALQVGTDYILVSAEPDLNREVVLQRKFPKNEREYESLAYPFGERLTGESIVTQFDDDTWRKQRAIFNPAFFRNALMDYMKQFNEVTDTMMQKLRLVADGKTKISMLEEFHCVTFDIIALVAFGISLNSVNDSNFKLNTLIDRVTKATLAYYSDPFFKIHKWGKIKEYKQTVVDLREKIRDIFIQRLNSVIENEEELKNDIMSIMIRNIRKGGDKVDLEPWIDEFVTFFLAGQDTTSNLLAFVVLELTQNPLIMEKLRKEIDEVVGAKSELTNDDLNNLTYTNCVIKETLRKWPSGTAIVRQVNIDDFYYNGQHIPKGTPVLISILASQRDERFFPNPEQFIPERFLPDSPEAKQNTINNHTYIPFSMGERNCIGQNFSKMEAKVILVKLLQNFDIELDPTQSFAIDELDTIRPRDGVKVFLRARS